MERTAGPRRLQATDLFRLRLIREAALSPDGSRICFCESTMEAAENEYRYRLWLLPAEGGEPSPLTSDGHREIAPAWSPDGTQIAFLSSRSGSQQLWLIRADGSGAEQVTQVRGVGGRPVWSPDGSQIALTITVGPGGLEPAVTEQRSRRRSPRLRYTADVRRIDTLPYKLNGVGFLGDRFTQIAVVAARANAQPRLLTAGPQDHSEPAWSPDGRSIAFAVTTAQMREQIDPRRLLAGEIGLIVADGTAMRILTRGLGPASSPAFSPDGRTIAYVGHDSKHGAYTHPSLWTVPVDGGEPRNLTAHFDRPFGDRSTGDLTICPTTPPPVWSADGQHLYHLVSDSGTVHLVRASLSDSQVHPVTSGPRVTYQFSFARNAARVALCQSDPLTPSDLSLLDLVPDAAERRLTRRNQQFVDSITLTSPERYAFRSGGAAVEGWILRPPGPAGEAAPAVLEVHGGPMLMYGARFCFEFHLLAAHGFTVVFTNPHGSMGYGQAFAAAIRGDWGNQDCRDLINGIEAAIRRGGIDRERVGIAGGSYGGYMVSWLISQTDRFRAAIAMRSIASLVSHFGASDTGFASALDWGGPPWVLPERYRERSPLSQVEQIKTPLLLIHGMQDLRCPSSEAEQLYTALRWQNREAVLLLYPGENHNLSRSGEPWHRVHRLEAILDWFKSHLEQQSPAD